MKLSGETIFRIIALVLTHLVALCLGFAVGAVWQVDHTPPENAALPVIIANEYSNEDIKASADYVCDGTNDQSEINAAITDLIEQGGGMIYLEPGDYIITESIGAEIVYVDRYQTITVIPEPEVITETVIEYQQLRGFESLDELKAYVTDWKSRN